MTTYRAVTDLGWTPGTNVSSALASFISGTAANGDWLDLEGETFHLTGNPEITKSVSIKNGGIHFPAALTEGGVALLWTGVSNVTLEDLTITDNGYYAGVNTGVEIENSSDILIQRCSVDLGAKAGIKFKGTSNVVVRKTEVQDTAGFALGNDHAGRYLVLIDSGSGFEFYENRIHHSRDEGIKTFPGVTNGVRDLYIHHNVFEDLAWDALDLTGGGGGLSAENPSRFVNNILRRCNGIDFKCIGEFGGPGDYWKWFEVSNNYSQNGGTFLTFTTMDPDSLLSTNPADPHYYVKWTPHDIYGTGNIFERTVDFVSAWNFIFYLNKGSIDTTFDNTTYKGTITTGRTLDTQELIDLCDNTPTIASLLNQRNDWGTVTTEPAAATADTFIPFTYGPYAAESNEDGTPAGILVAPKIGALSATSASGISLQGIVSAPEVGALAVETLDLMVDRVLEWAQTHGTQLTVCSQEPATYAEIAIYGLATDASVAVGGPGGAAAARSVAVPTTALVASASGSAAAWALHDGSGTLVAAGDLGGVVGITAGFTYGMGGFAIGF